MNRQSGLGFLGSGNMAEAIMRSVLKSGLFSASQIIASDVSRERRAVFQKLGSVTTESNAEVCEKADTIICGVKPQALFAVLKDIQGSCAPEHLFILLAAGIDTESVEKHLKGVPVIKVMPNLPMLVGSGACALSKGSHADDSHMERAKHIIQTGGIAVELNENMMDIVTALSGSGPAYFLYIVETLLKAAGDEGLNRDIAEKLLFQTVKGTADMLLQTGSSPEKLRQMITVPEGTTEAAFKYFDKNDLGGTLREGFKEAVERSKQLRHKDS